MKKKFVLCIFVSVFFIIFGLATPKESRAEIDWFIPASYQIITGTQISGNLASVISKDGDVIDIQEASGVSPIEIIFDFENVENIKDYFSYIRYEGSASHFVRSDIFNYTLATWTPLLTTPDTNTNYIAEFSPLITENDYISATGTASIRFFHIQSGNTAHHLYIDFVGLRSAGTSNITSTSTAQTVASLSNIENITALSTTTQISASESVTQTTYTIPYILFRFFMSLVVICFVVLFLFYFIKNEKK